MICSRYGRTKHLWSKPTRRGLLWRRQCTECGCSEVGRLWYSSQWNNLDGIGVALFLVFSLLIAALIWWNWNYVCVRERHYPCQNTHCVMHDENGFCLSYMMTNDTCWECLEWEERK